MRTITFLVEESDDPNSKLTCVYCGCPNTNMEFLIAGDGRKAWIGVHSKCLDALDEKNAKLNFLAVNEIQGE